MRRVISAFFLACITAGRTYKTRNVRPSAQTLRQLLEQGPLTCSCENYGGFEKVVCLGEDLLSDDEEITTQPGDIVLYDNDKLVMFHAFNTWSYTRIGTIAYDDEVLKRAASTLEIAYGFDHCYRFGGDEFMVIALYESDEVIRQSDTAVRRTLNSVSLLGKNLSIHISVGVVHGTCETELELRAMMKNADAALYEAKQNGKNRICIKD